MHTLTQLCEVKSYRFIISFKCTIHSKQGCEDEKDNGIAPGKYGGHEHLMETDKS